MCQSNPVSDGRPERPLGSCMSQIISGLTVAMLAAAVVRRPALQGIALFGYVAIGLLLIGTILLLPRLLALLLRLLPLPAHPSALLAREHLRASPAPASMSLAAIVAAVSLTVSMVIMVASFRQSLDEWLTRVLPADLYVRAALAGDTAFLSLEDQRRIVALPGVRHAEFLRSEQVLLDPARVPRLFAQLDALAGGVLAYTEEDEPPSIEAYVDVKVRGVAEVFGPGRDPVDQRGFPDLQAGAAQRADHRPDRRPHPGRAEGGGAGGGGAVLGHAPGSPREPAAGHAHDAHRGAPLHRAPPEGRGHL